MVVEEPPGGRNYQEDDQRAKGKEKQRCGSCEEVYIERGQMFVSVRVTR